MADVSLAFNTGGAHGLRQDSYTSAQNDHRSPRSSTSSDSSKWFTIRDMSLAPPEPSSASATAKTDLAHPPPAITAASPYKPQMPSPKPPPPPAAIPARHPARNPLRPHVRSTSLDHLPPYDHNMHLFHTPHLPVAAWASDALAMQDAQDQPDTGLPLRLRSASLSDLSAYTSGQPPPAGRGHVQPRSMRSSPTRSRSMQHDLPVGTHPGGISWPDGRAPAMHPSSQHLMQQQAAAMSAWAAKQAAAGGGRRAWNAPAPAPAPADLDPKYMLAANAAQQLLMQQQLQQQLLLQQLLLQQPPGRLPYHTPRPAAGQPPHRHPDSPAVDAVAAQGDVRPRRSFDLPQTTPAPAPAKPQRRGLNYAAPPPQPWQGPPNMAAAAAAAAAAFYANTPFAYHPPDASTTPPAADWPPQHLAELAPPKPSDTDPEDAFYAAHRRRSFDAVSSTIKASVHKLQSTIRRSLEYVAARDKQAATAEWAADASIGLWQQHPLTPQSITTDSTNGSEVARQQQQLQQRASPDGATTTISSASQLLAPGGGYSTVSEPLPHVGPRPSGEHRRGPDQRRPPPAAECGCVVM